MSARVCTRKRGIEVRERLVHQEDERLAHDGPGQGDTLALAARELGRLAPQQPVQPERLGRPLHLGGALGPCPRRAGAAGTRCSSPTLRCGYSA